MTAVGLDWKTTAPLMHSSSNEGVIQLSPLSSYAVLEVVEISHACFVHLLLQYARHTAFTHCQLDLNSANLEATVVAECENGIFQWRHNPVINTQCSARIDGTRMSVWFCAKNCQTLSKYFKIMVKILSVPFYRASAYCRAIDIANLSVCLSVRLTVCLSVTYRYQMETA